MSEDGTDRFRKQAPKQSVEAPGNPPGKIYPDWFWAMSGGIDSVAAYLLTRDAIHDNYSKRPMMLHWDTRIGLPLNRLYLEKLADTYDEILVPVRTHEKFEDRVAKRGKFADRDDAGPPGGAQHGPVRNELKGRQADKMMTLADLPVVVIGLRAEESDERAKMDKVEHEDGITEVRPVHRLSKRECARIILQHEECPINPCWLWRHPSDCFCLANGDPSELDRAEERFPWFTQRIREYEEAAQPAKEEEWSSVLGWDGLLAVERDAKQAGQEQTTITTCGGGCQREQDPRITEAFRARLDGATVGEAIALLDGQNPDGVDLVAATDGGNHCNVEPGSDRFGGESDEGRIKPDNDTNE